MSIFAGFAYGIGLILLLTFLTGFLLQKKIFGIQPLLFELLGASSVCFGFGLEKEYSVGIIFVVIVVLATLFDPYVWRKMGLKIAEEKTVSLGVNGAVLLVGSFSFFLGFLAQWQIQ